MIPTRHHYEELNPGLPRFGGDVFWDDWDTLFYFATDASPSLGDGLFELRFIGYAADAGDDLVAGTEEVIDTCGLPTWETAYLRIDNQLNPNHPAVDHTCGGTTSHICVDEPDAYIRSLVKNEGLWNEQPVSVCDIVDLQPTDTLTVHFSVTVPATAQGRPPRRVPDVGRLRRLAALLHRRRGYRRSVPRPDLGRVPRHLRGRSGRPPSRSARPTSTRSRRARRGRTGTAATTR